MVTKKRQNQAAFNRPSQQRAKVVNFKDCRPTKSLHNSSVGEGEVAFVPHVGNVKFIEKSNLKIEIQSKRSETQVKDTDEYKLKEVIDLQRNIYMEAVA